MELLDWRRGTVVSEACLAPSLPLFPKDATVQRNGLWQVRSRKGSQYFYTPQGRESLALLTEFLNGREPTKGNKNSD
ncbi:hypothetical protein E2C01_018980 [Portunus trituberculatus]|uniref:Uncharacterized protein n=1 Tax=Portunus trituberculatus TaxID=210409 RepID=A0A5B7DXU2_PORTR|nr:hypothetical protein [Portunus trituberculatus]